MSAKVILFSLSGAGKLTDKIAKILNLPHHKIYTQVFADGETFCKSLISVRNKKVILVQSISKPVNDSLMELLITIDALKRASANEINIVLPYFAYARQDRKAQGREPITAKLVANLLQVAGASRVMVMDIHSDQVQGFFDIPVDTLRAMWTLLDAFSEHVDMHNMCVVSPDYGGVKRARNISNILNIPLAIIDKRRSRPNEVEMENILGDVANKNCVIVDDMIDTGGTIIKSAAILKKKGARNVYTIASHGLFSRDAEANFEKAYQDGIITKIYVTDTIQSVYDLKISNLEVVSLDKFYAKLLEIYVEDYGSISEIYKVYQNKILANINKKLNEN